MLTHPVWGVPVFHMHYGAGIFSYLFVGDFLKGGLEYALGIISELVRAGNDRSACG